MGLENRISELGSILTIKLAEKIISLSEFKDYNIGTILDFNKFLDEEVDILLHNKIIGKAELKLKDNVVYLKITKVYE